MSPSRWATTSTRRSRPSSGSGADDRSTVLGHWSTARRHLRTGSPHPPIRVMSARRIRREMDPRWPLGRLVVARLLGGALMEWAVAGLIGAVAGYGVRLWQEKLPNLVKGPAEAASRTAGAALGAGASMGGRAAGAALGAGA